jgi:hypothetical protein
MFRAFEVELQPSRVLYEMQPESYRVYLAEFEPESERVDSDATTGGQLESAA